MSLNNKMKRPPPLTMLNQSRKLYQSELPVITSRAASGVSVHAETMEAVPHLNDDEWGKPQVNNQIGMSNTAPSVPLYAPIWWAFDVVSGRFDIEPSLERDTGLLVQIHTSPYVKIMINGEYVKSMGGHYIGSYTAVKSIVFAPMTEDERYFICLTIQ